MERSINKSRFYSAEMKMADLILNDVKLLSLIERFGIRLGFGDSSVNSVCKRYDLPTALFLTVCNIYSFDDYVPTSGTLSTDDLIWIIRYLKASHKYYTDKYFPRLHENIHQMVNGCDETNRKILNKFYDDYDVEVKRHFNYEDQTVFPYVEKLIDQKQCSDGYTIAMFQQNHSDIDEKLNDLKSLIIKYLPEECPSDERHNVVNAIFSIEEDLARHTAIENHLLIPMVKKIENKR